jgi:FG-GAP-like repeat/FG-GAP repeat
LTSKETIMDPCVALRLQTIVLTLAWALMSLALLWQMPPALAQFIQPGTPLNAIGESGRAGLGRSVALSADGNTAVAGGPIDNLHAGATWVFTRSGRAWTLQGSKLVGSDAVGSIVNQGYSVAVSADGNTAVVGGPNDNSGVGAAWVFTRSSGVWSQQGAKLVGTSASGSANQGWSVALSGDGNTAIVGGPNDNGGVGAVWVFTRSGGVWTQQGAKLVGTGLVGNSGQGVSTALSADGNTAVVGGPYDNSGSGATWVFTRSAGVWSQQGAKLVGTGADGNPSQGSSVALSADGNTAVVGGPWNASGTGAAWVFTRSGGIWTQQGAKLVGTGAVGGALQGSSVALSGDGKVALLGGPNDTYNGEPAAPGWIGAAWVFVRSGSVWSQGSKLASSVGSGEDCGQGASVGLDADGNTAIVGGPNCSNGDGAAWVFVAPTAATHDFNRDGISDIAWRHSGGTAAGWVMAGTPVTVSQAGSLGVVPTTWSIVGQRDFNGDGHYDWLWRDTSGNVAIWLLNGLQILQTGSLGNVGSTWTISGTGDFDGDGKGDILWRENGGMVAIWLLNGLQVSSSGGLGTVPGTWVIAGIGDFNGDGKWDILWRDTTTGTVAIWLLNGLQVSSSGSLGTVASTWHIAGTGDFNGDGRRDILWRDDSGAVAIWLLDGLQVTSSGGLGTVPPEWVIAETGDFDGDGKSDILWRNTSNGSTAIWFLNGLQVSSSAGLGTVALDWTIQGLNAD